MDAVRAFNNELSSLYESKPPVSRAKMAQVTKCAIKAIKFYKHVVQSVEKFIQKCKPEYKVPGLYVIDSIVRQSRHQFGPEKDVFSPRFTKNIVATFTNLFKCPEEERSRVVRVLNLWQKNCVFPMEVIQPLLDLAADPNSTELVSAVDLKLPAQNAVDGVVNVSQKVPVPGPQPSANGGDTNSNQVMPQSISAEMLSTITKLLQQAKEGNISSTAPESQLQQLQHLQQQLVMQTERISKPQQSAPPIDNNLLAQIQMLTNQLLNKTSGSAPEPPAEPVKQNNAEPVFNRELLDFDYGDTDEEDDRQDHHQHIQQVQPPPPVTPQPRPQPGTPQGSVMMPDQNLLQQIQKMSQQQQMPQQIHQIQQIPQQFQQIPQPQQIQMPQTQQVHQIPQPQQVQMPQPQQLHQIPQPQQIQMPQPQQVHQIPQPPQISQHQQQIPQILPMPPQQMPPMSQQQMPPIPQQIPQINQQLMSQPIPPLAQQQVPQQIPPMPQQIPSIPQQQMPQQIPPMSQQPFPPMSQQPFPPMSHQQIPAMPPQQVQPTSQQEEQMQLDFGDEEQIRRHHLEQQQQQFDREIGQASIVSHIPSPGQPQPGFNQSPDRRQDDDQDERNNQGRTDRGDRHRRRGSRDRSRSPRRRSRRSRSRSRDRRKRSRSRDRYRRSRSRERERRERERDRERERERRKMGLPPLRDNHISICSTTLWFGRLTKHTTEEELKEHINKYGVVRTINMIPPRGCAFVSLTKRRDANKALDRLRGVKINGNSIKVAWAPGIGVKESVFKDLWDVDLGVTYIPWEQLPADVTTLIPGGMIDEESLPEKLKGIRTEEEDIDETQPQQNENTDNERMEHEENKMLPQQQPLPALPMGLPGQPPRFPPPGQGPMGILGPGGPLSLLGGPPPPIGVPLRAIAGPGHNLRLPNNLGGPNPMGVPLGFGGPRPNMPEMNPRPMNMGSQGPMMGLPGNRFGGPGGPNPGMDNLAVPRGMNPPGLRIPFGQFNNNLPRPPFMPAPGMRPPFFNDNAASNRPSMGDSDMRAVAEPKEWPPDDEVNADDESDDDRPSDSDERMLPMGRNQQVPGPGLANIRAVGNPFETRGPLPPNSLLGIPRIPSPNTRLPPLLPIHMIPPGQQPPVLAIPGSPAPGFALAPGLPMPPVGVRPGFMPAATSPHLLPPTAAAASVQVAVSLNGSVVVARPPQPASSVTVSAAGGDGLDASLPNADMQSSQEDMMLPRLPGPIPPMQIQGGPSGGPILGRGFAPMTIRPRGGPGLMGLRPGAQGGFGRFGGPRPVMGPAFGAIDRPPFVNRFGAPLRPPVEFLDQDEREDRDDRRTLPRPDIEIENDPEANENLSNDIDERRESSERKGRQQDVDLRQDIDERSKTGRASSRSSRWSSEDKQNESSKSVPAGDQTKDLPNSNLTESGVGSTLSADERTSSSGVAQQIAGASPIEFDAPEFSTDSSASKFNSAVPAVTEDGDGSAKIVVSGEIAAEVQIGKGNDATVVASENIVS